jgi:diacylglycerol kinase (ATP)
MIEQEDPLAQKSRTGLTRLYFAFGYSISGFKVAMKETAFRQEVIMALVAIPLAFWVGSTLLETLFLIAVVVLVMIVELLNTGIEKAIDRVGVQYHELSKISKDLGSAAVLLSLVLANTVWIALAWKRFFV